MGFSLRDILNPSHSFDSGDWQMALADAALPGIQGGTWNPVYTSLYNSGNTPSWYDTANSREGIHNWVDDMSDFAGFQLSSWEDQLKNNPAQAFLGAGDPISTKLWNEALKKDWKPMVSAYGGPTRDTLNAADASGMDTSNIRGVDSTMRSVIPAIASFINPALGTAVAGLGAWGDGLESGESGWDSFKGGLGAAAKSYLGGQVMPDWWKSIGMDASTVGNIANSTANGAILGAAGGGSGTEGAKGGLAGGVFNAGLGYLNNTLSPMPDEGTIGGNMRDADGEVSYGDGPISPAQARANEDLLAPSAGAGYVPQALKSEQPSQESTNPVAAFLGAFTQGRGTGGQGPSYLDMAGNAMGMYNAYRQRQRIKDQLSTLKDMYSENSPYAQRLASKMDRQAAMSGRRSQTGARQTQLQALLAEAALRNQPQTAQLLGLQDEQSRRMAANAIQGVSRLGSMFPTTPRPQQQTVPSFDGLGSLSNYWSQ